MLLHWVLVDLRVGVDVTADVLLLLGFLVALAHGIDIPADVALLQRVLVDLRGSVDVPVGDVHDLGILQPDDLELHGGFRNLRK